MLNLQVRAQSNKHHYESAIEILQVLRTGPPIREMPGIIIDQFPALTVNITLRSHEKPL